LFLAGIVGARLFYLIQKPDHVFESARTVGDYVLAAINLREGGLVFYGSVLGGIAAYLVFCRRRKIDALYLADVVVPPILVGVAFGRLGCLLNGCCFGDVCSLPWKITFPLGSVPDMSLVQQGLLFPDSLSSLPLHPTQVYSSLDAIILACLTAAYFPRRAFNGAVTVLGLTTYAVTRFAIEILRGDEAGQFGTALTIAQWLSIGVFIYAIGLGLWCWHRRGRKACPDSLPDQ
jgi:phosphatidylglycerol:prolipoprotein diacylglycerol transferase